MALTLAWEGGDKRSLIGSSAGRPSARVSPQRLPPPSPLGLHLCCSDSDKCFSISNRNYKTLKYTNDFVFISDKFWTRRNLCSALSSFPTPRCIRSTFSGLTMTALLSVSGISLYLSPSLLPLLALLVKLQLPLCQFPSLPSSPLSLPLPLSLSPSLSVSLSFPTWA